MYVIPIGQKNNIRKEISREFLIAHITERWDPFLQLLSGLQTRKAPSQSSIKTTSRSCYRPWTLDGGLGFRNPGFSSLFYFIYFLMVNPGFASIPRNQRLQVLRAGIMLILLECWHLFIKITSVFFLITISESLSDKDFPFLRLTNSIPNTKFGSGGSQKFRKSKALLKCF